MTKGLGMRKLLIVIKNKKDKLKLKRYITFFFFAAIVQTIGFRIEFKFEFKFWTFHVHLQ